MAPIREIRIEEVKDMLRRRESFLLIDIRSETEWGKGHILGAQHIGRNGLVSDIAARVPDKTQPIILYCGDGSSSAAAAELLQQFGYHNVRSMQGGWQSWCDAGFVKLL